MIVPRKYQQDGVDEIRQKFSEGVRRVAYSLPTGGGKTVVFCHITKMAADRGKKVWILVHRIELLRQTSQALTANGVEHGLVNPKFTPKPHAAVQVAMVQTLTRRLGKYPAPDLIITDECHHANAGQWQTILNNFPNAYSLGVSATLTRADGKPIREMFDVIVQGPQISELIEMGFLVRPRVYAPAVQLDFGGVKLRGKDYDAQTLAEILDKPMITGDAVRHYSKLCPGTPAVVFCVNVRHAEHVAEAFRNAGFKAFSVDGTMDDATRSRILGGLADGSTEVAASCDLISEGTDIPAIGCAILLRATKSEGLYIQQVGRALRKSPGKSYAIILDHVGNTMRHGMPDEFRRWSLDVEPKKKGKKRDAEQAIRVVQCSSCYMVFTPAPMCPACGTMIAANKLPQERDGELVEVSPEEAERLRHERQREVAKTRSLSDLIELGKKLGHKPGWAFMLHKTRK
jgi:DNA repair protein RadD